MSLISLFVASVLTQNIILTKFLGICPFIGTTNKEKTALNMGMTVTLIVMISSIVSYILYKYVLIPTNTLYLKTIIFILIIAGIVQVVEIIIKKYNYKIYKDFGIYLPLITTNCAVLGIVLLNIASDYNLIEVIVFSLGSGIGFTLVMYIFSSLREHLDKSPIPNSFKGVPIALLTAGIMALIFTRYMV